MTSVNSPQVLVVDDEVETCKYLRMNLQARGYKTLVATDGTEALQLFNERRFELILLDITMPGPDGLQVCEHIRRVSDVPIIILSAQGRESIKVRALNLGADDYMTKPFGVREFLARVGAAIRSRGHRGSGSVDDQIEAGDLRIDLVTREVSRAGKPVQLTSTEFHLLSLLMRNANKMLTHRYIIQAVWGESYSDEREYLRAYMYRLRRKLERDPSTPSHLLSMPGMGYKFSTESIASNTD